jgi:hypothetical protein
VLNISNDTAHQTPERKGRWTMTNLLATIVVMVLTTTNDIPRWSPQTFRDNNQMWVMYVDEASDGVPMVDWQTGKTNCLTRFPTSVSGDASERVRVVQTKRVSRITFGWNGKPREIVDEEILNETRTVLVRHETWLPR